MKNVIRGLAMGIIGFTFAVLVDAINLTMLVLACISKCVRVGFLWVWERVAGIEDEHDELKAMTNYMVNYAYKYVLDKLYPTEEDEP